MNSLLTRFFTLAAVLLTICAFRIEATQQEAPHFQRIARNFPYSSLAFSKMFRPAGGSMIQPMAAFQWPGPVQSREVRDLINMIDEEGQQAYGLERRERRSAGPVFKRYACRFKFCRIY
ncbi:hypothetical protein M3Y97_00213600 [Aphelenchoides bicaudatus]|nr:hypothetical protein M3Y97_00213600 [Aphelenchoides bicaudatus]